MGQNKALIVDGVAKKFARSLNRAMRYGIQDIACDLMGISTRPERLRREEFWAVKDVSFELEPGDTLGIIGPNGSGKSTLLKMLNGIIRPDIGRIQIDGRMGALIDVGAGFHPVLTGRENIYVNGTILGMSRDEIRKKFDSIVDFAEIENFLDVPVKNYSSGMYVRLGFAIAAHCEPDILLVDEVLSVGDIAFQKKCFRFLEEDILDKGVTVILVSHSMYTIARMCRDALVLNKGQVVFQGDSQKAVPEFYKIMREFSRTEELAVDTAGNIRSGAGEIRLHNVTFVDETGKEQTSIRAGGNVEINLVLRVQRDFKRMPSLLLRLLDTSNTIVANCILPQEERQNFFLKAGNNLVHCAFPFFNLMPGTYTLAIKIGGGGDLLQDNVINAMTIEVVDTENNIYRTTSGVGILYLLSKWSLDN